MAQNWCSKTLHSYSNLDHFQHIRATKTNIPFSLLPSKLASPSTTPPEKPHLESRVSFCAQQTPGVQFLSNNSAAVVSPTKKITLPETNSKFAREIPWLEDVFPFGMAFLGANC